MKKYKDTDYYITETGEAFSKKSGELKKLNPGVSKLGYHRIGISSNGIMKSMLVHRMVGELFIPNPYNKPEINHIDGNKDNNHYLNLEWNTRKENVQHAFDTGLQKGLKGEQHGYSKLTEDNVKWIRENYIPHNREFSSRALGRKFGVSQGQIHHIIKNEYWNHI